MRKSVSGFTIVELLIVIIVIAILATISVVAYNGVRQRAKFTQQEAEVDKVGRAVQLWVAENGVSLGTSGHGYDGKGYGRMATADTGDYPPISLEDMLRNAGYLTDPLSVNTGYMLTPCTTLDSPRWVVLATLNPAPPTSVADQIASSGCTHSLLNTYTSHDYSYRKNFLKAF